MYAADAQARAKIASAERALRENALRDHGSLFKPGSDVWTAEPFRELAAVFVAQPDTGDRKFFEKLRDQLAPASDDAVQLMAELLFTHFLITGTVSGKKKREDLRLILDWMSTPVQVPIDLDGVLDYGLVNPGTPYNTRRDLQLSFLINFGVRWTELSVDEVTRALDDPWCFRDLLLAIPLPNLYPRLQREGLAHLVHPDTFEPIVSVPDKQRIVAAFAEHAGEDAADLDRALVSIRQALEPELGSGFDFYRPPASDVWRTKPNADAEGDERVSLALVVYVGQNSQANLKVGLDNGTWGFKAHLDEYDEISAGDFLVLASGFDGGSPRVGAEVWSQHTVGDVVVGRINRAFFEATEPLWPDEVGEVLYPSRLRFEVVAKSSGLDLSGQGELTAEMSEALRLSSINQGRGYVVAADGPLFAVDGEERTTATERLDLEWLERRTHWDRAELQDLIDALTTRTPQVVLAGPPGTGKTWVAKQVAAFLTSGDPDATRLAQFHPSYGYEEFIEGLRPVVEDGGIAFRRTDGLVLELAKRATLQDTNHVLVIDEMNRANLPRVLGELMYLFEYRNEPADLLFTKNYRLPENLLFIGTMNTADRSIRSIDVALRRRFEIFECPPSSKVLERFYAAGARCDVEGLIEGFEALNAALTEQFDRHHTIGHSFFMADHLTPDGLRRTWNRQLFPLIEEYFFDRPDVAAQYEAARFWPSVG